MAVTQVVPILLAFGLSFGGIYVTSNFLLRRRLDIHTPQRIHGFSAENRYKIPAPTSFPYL